MAESEKPKARRLSLTKKQREAGAGLELLALLQSTASDGHLTAGEVEGLKAWLVANQAADLPGIGFLRGVVDQVLADGQVTPEEEDELWDAVLKVLPPDEREVAKSARWPFLEERSRQAREAWRAKLLEEQTAAGLWDFMVAGVFFGNRAAVVDEHLVPGDDLELVREPHNSFDLNAVLIQLPDVGDIGYVPAVLAKRMAPLLDAGKPYQARCKKILNGSHVPVPVVVVSFTGVLPGVEADVVDVGPAATSPEPLPRPSFAIGSSPSPVGTPVWAIILLVVLFFACFVGLAWMKTRSGLR